jgi:Tol biopolymer transport system component/putative intracellular protease/amidase
MQRWIVAFALLIAVSLLAAPTAAGQDHPPGQIVFTSDRDGDTEIYIMNEGGTDQRRLTEQRGFDAMPDFSPDGTQIAFISARGGNQDVWIMNTDGGDLHQLTTTPGMEFHPAWSPDGTQIAFMARRGTNIDVYVINADGTDERRLTDDPALDGQPTWSPDGRRIAFVSQRDGNWQIYSMDADGGAVQRLTHDDTDDSYPKFSPDGAQIAYEAKTHDGSNDTTELYTMNADGSDVQRLTENEYFDSMPVWSADGSQLVFVSDRGGDWSLYRMDADGTNVIQVTSENAHHQDWWQPSETAAHPAVLLVFGQQFIPTIYETEVPLLEEAGQAVIVASRTLDPLATKGSSLQVPPDLLLEDVRVEDYDAIIFNCDNDLTFGNAKDQTSRIAQEAVATGKVVGAICSGPRVLAYADVVTGRITTGEPSQTCRMLEDAGAICTGAQVERDGRMITARDRYAVQRFTKTILEALSEPAAPDIVYYSDADGNAEIYVMNADGSGQRRLTFNEVEDSSPAWSPDGTHIVFISDRNDPNPSGCFPNCNTDIYVMDADGAHERPLTGDPAIESHPDWSPDGQTILFDADREGDGLDEIWRMNADGSDQQVLIDSGFNDHWGDWSPDGTRIVFVSDRDGQPELYVAEADGAHPQRLTNNDLGEIFPAWSPDGTRIAFMTAAYRSRHLYVLAQDEQGAWRVIDLGIEGEDPAWSPDGAYILFQDDRDGDFDIYITGADGSHSRPLTANHAGDFWPDWRPNR